MGKGPMSLQGLRIVIGSAAITAPALHFVTDVMELANGGFTPLQLWLNYIAFLVMPFLFVGLYSVQSRRAHWATLVGAVLYGTSFIYFSFTTLFALQESVPNYPTLWNEVRGLYVFHGGMMIVGGLLFGSLSLLSGVLNRLGLALFIAGLLANLLVTFVPVTETFQIVGSVLRNFGLIIVGLDLIRIDLDALVGRSAMN